MITFNEWLAEEGWMRNLGLSLALGAGVVGCKKTTAPITAPIAIEKQYSVNDVRRCMDNEQVKEFVLDTANKVYGQHPDRFEVKSMREYMEKQWGRRWPQVLKTATDNRDQKAIDKSIPDVKNLDAPVVVAYYPLSVIRSRSRMSGGQCEHITLTLSSGEKVYFKMCALPNEETLERGHTRDMGAGEEYRHSLQNYADVSMVIPNFPLQKVDQSKREFVQYLLIPTEFWAKFSMFKNEYYKKTGVIGTKKDASRMLNFLLNRKHEFSPISRDFATLFEETRNVDRTEGTNYYQQLIEIIDSHLDQLIYNSRWNTQTSIRA